MVFVSNLYYTIKLLQLFPGCLIYSSCVALSIFVVLSNFCHFLTPCYLFTFYVIYAPYKCTCCTHHKHNSLSCLIVHTLSAPIYLSNSPGVFGHRAILIWGIETWLGFFSKNYPILIKIMSVSQVKPSKPYLHSPILHTAHFMAQGYTHSHELSYILTFS